jgi:hypothetical protein
MHRPAKVCAHTLFVWLPVNATALSVCLVANFTGEVGQLYRKVDDVHLRLTMCRRTPVDPLHTDRPEPALTLQRSGNSSVRLGLRLHLLGAAAAALLMPTPQQHGGHAHTGHADQR